jgi:hypothetical protein
MKSSRTLAAAIAAGALIAIPATASASEGPSATDVKSYTAKADVSLDRAISMFTRGNHAPGLKAFRQSRAYLGKAKALSTKLTKSADTDAERAQAARAWQFLAVERDENLAQLVKLLSKVNAKTDKIVATALLADTKHRDAAIGIIQDLINQGVTSNVEAGLNRVIAALTSGRAAEIGAQVNLLAEIKLPADAQKSIALAIQANLGAQARVAAVLDSLIPQLPEDARGQLEKALDLVNQQLEAAADMMDDVDDLLPPFVRPMVQGILNDVKDMIQAITAPWVQAPGAETPSTGTPTTDPGTPTTVPQLPLPFPIPMPSFVMDIINQILPGGLPILGGGTQTPDTPVPGVPVPNVQDIFSSFFGPNGFMSGLFGGGTSTGGGLFGGLFGNGA